MFPHDEKALPAPEQSGWDKVDIDWQTIQRSLDFDTASSPPRYSERGSFMVDTPQGSRVGDGMSTDSTPYKAPPLLPPFPAYSVVSPAEITWDHQQPLPYPEALPIAVYGQRFAESAALISASSSNAIVDSLSDPQELVARSVHPVSMQVTILRDQLMECAQAINLIMESGRKSDLDLTCRLDQVWGFVQKVVENSQVNFGKATSDLDLLRSSLNNLLHNLLPQQFQIYEQALHELRSSSANLQHPDLGHVLGMAPRLEACCNAIRDL
jgi:hypothetical protein